MKGTGGLESWTDERQPHTGQHMLTAWQWEVEKEVLASAYGPPILDRHGREQVTRCTES